jgi:uncharacterized protein (DUF433 family)
MMTERIDIDPTIMMGKPVIRGTRITVELILRKLAVGTSEGDLLEDYPHLTTEDVRAAVAYGAVSVAHEEVVLLPNEPLASTSGRRKLCQPVIQALREAGHDVVAITEIARGATDDQVLERALKEKRVLITEDRDFRELVYARGRSSAGVILGKVSRPGAPGQVRDRN